MSHFSDEGAGEPRLMLLTCAVIQNQMDDFVNAVSRNIRKHVLVIGSKHKVKQTSVVLRIRMDNFVVVVKCNIKVLDINSMVRGCASLIFIPMLS